MITNRTDLDLLTGNVIGACIEVHQILGPGLLEKIYLECLCHELTLRNIDYEREFIIPLRYKDLVFSNELRADLLIEDTLILELKSVKELNPLFEAQLISYLRIADKPQGLLINFNVPLLKDGIRKLFKSASNTHVERKTIP